MGDTSDARRRCFPLFRVLSFRYSGRYILALAQITLTRFDYRSPVRPVSSQTCEHVPRESMIVRNGSFTYIKRTQQPVRKGRFTDWRSSESSSRKSTSCVTRAGAKLVSSSGATVPLEVRFTGLMLHCSASELSNDYKVRLLTCARLCGCEGSSETR
jgi:hypothetical protein